MGPPLSDAELAMDFYGRFLVKCLGVGGGGVKFTGSCREVGPAS